MLEPTGPAPVVNSFENYRVVKPGFHRHRAGGELYWR